MNAEITRLAHEVAASVAEEGEGRGVGLLLFGLGAGLDGRRGHHRRRRAAPAVAQRPGRVHTRSVAGCCDPSRYDDFFSERFARRMGKRYRRRGLDRTATRLADFLAPDGAHDLEGATVLDASTGEPVARVSSAGVDVGGERVHRRLIGHVQFVGGAAGLLRYGSQTVGPYLHIGLTWLSRRRSWPS